MLAGRLMAAGHGYDQVATSMAFDPGAGVGLRAGAWLGRRLAMWVDAGVSYWAIEQEIEVAGLAQALVVPRLDAAISLGGTFVIGR